MLRLALFFGGVFVLMGILSRVPVLGAVFRIPFLGFWITAILLSAVLAKLAADAVDRRRRTALVRQLGAVDTPHNRGKLGSLYASQRRWGKAIEHLESAAAGEPEHAEWHYRLGVARLRSGRQEEARQALERAVELDEEHAYGAAMLRLAEAAQGMGDGEAAAEIVGRFERNHGPSPESAYRRGVALAGLGRGEEAKGAFAEAGDLAKVATKYQRREGGAWARRARIARMRVGRG